MINKLGEGWRSRPGVDQPPVGGDQPEEGMSDHQEGERPPALSCPQPLYPLTGPAGIFLSEQIMDVEAGHGGPDGVQGELPQQEEESGPGRGGDLPYPAPGDALLLRQGEGGGEELGGEVRVHWSEDPLTSPGQTGLPHLSSPQHLDLVPVRVDRVLTVRRGVKMS